MRKGLGILDQAVGRNNPRFFMADLAYSRVLDRLGLQAEATQQRMSAEQARTEYYSHQCMGCTIPVSALQ